MKTFPKPLSQQEEQQYLKLWQAGDLAARNVLIERNLRLVAHVIKKFSCNEEELEDLLSIGTIGLIKAVNTYDPDRAGRLATYAGKCIENEILMFFRSRKKLSREVSLYDPIGTDKEGNEMNLIDIIEAQEEDVVGQMQLLEDISRLSHYMKQVLTPREYEILILRYGLRGGKEVTQREIAKKEGISRSYVSRIEKRALGKLRACFDGEI